MKTKKITILGTTDVHSDIWGYNYENNIEIKECGMANIYTYVKQVRQENSNTILIDNGDIIQGSILTDDLYNKGWKGSHPIAEVMNYMKYDAMVLGNHEFNFGLDMLDKFIKELRFPVLSANVTWKNDESLFTAPYSIIEKEGIKIGIIGLTTPGVSTWVGNKVDKLKFHSISESASKYIKKLKNIVDVIVVFAHCSLEGELKNEDDGCLNLLKLCPEIDVLMVGHFHITVNKRIGNTIVGAATDRGREVVKFDLYLDEDKKVISSNVEIVNMSNFRPSEEIRELPIVKEAHNKAIELANGKILGKASMDFQPPNEILWISQGRLQETPIIQLINKVQLINSNADISATSLIREYSDLKKGNITYGNIYSIYKFDTLLFVVELTGIELKAYMEWTASAYNKWQKGDISISFSNDVPSYQHDFFSGITYTIDLSKESGSRIGSIRLNGKEIRDDDVVKLAVSDYCYYTTLRGRGFTSNEPIWKSTKLIRDMLVDYVSENGVITPKLDNNWSIIGVDLESPYKKQVISMVNRGLIDIPYNKSLNIYELKEKGLI